MEISLEELASLVSKTATTGLKVPTAERCIVIADRGWVFVGLASRDAEWVYLEQASVVRRWGTTKGIGQLALEGPRTNTVLDPCGSVQIPVRSIAGGLIRCLESAWVR